MIPGDQIPHLVLPPAEIGTAQQPNIMDFNWKEADFIMYCIELFADGDKEFPYTIDNGLGVTLTTEQIKDLYQRVQQIKFHDLDMKFERDMAMAD